MKHLMYIVLAGLLLVGCVSPSASYRPPYIRKMQYDPEIIGTDVLGITVGMSPRRVLSEYNKNQWTLTSLSTMTLEDMIENRVQDSSFYISTKSSSDVDLEIHFQDGKVVFVRQTYSIEENEFHNEISRARNHLSSLGNFTEKVEGSSMKLTYNPYKTGYVYYDIHKLVKNQKGYRVWFAVVNY